MKPTATEPMARPSGFSCATPAARRAPSLTCSPSGVASLTPTTFDLIESFVPMRLSFARDFTSAL